MSAEELDVGTTAVETRSTDEEYRQRMRRALSLDGFDLAWLLLALICCLSVAYRSFAADLFAGSILRNMFVTEALLLLLAGWLFVTGRFRKLNRSATWRFEKYLIFFWLALTLGLVYSLCCPLFKGYDMASAVMLYRKYVLSILGGYFLSRVVARRPRQIRPLFIVLLAMAVVVGFVLATGRGYSFRDEYLERLGVRAGGEFALPLGFVVTLGANTGALYLMVFVLIGVALVFGGGRICWRLLGGAIVVAGLAGEVMLSTRAVLVVLIPGVLAVVMLSSKRRHDRASRLAQLGLLTLSLGGIVVAILFSAPPIEGLPYDQRDRLSVFFEGDSLTDRIDAIRGVGSIEKRTGQYAAYLPAALRNPLGYAFTDNYPQYEVEQPHSLHLRLLLTAGFLGWIFYLVVIVRMTVYWYRSLGHVEPTFRPFIVGMVVTNVLLLLMSWGYDFYNRFGIQLTYFLLSGFCTTLACRAQTCSGLRGGRPQESSTYQKNVHGTVGSAANSARSC